MELSNETLDAYYQLQLRFNVGWILIQVIFVLGLVLMGQARIGQYSYNFLSGRIKPWPLAALALYFLVALLLKSVESLIVHFLLTQKAQLDDVPFPSLIEFLGSQVAGNIASALALAIVGFAILFILKRRSRFTWLWLAIVVTIILSGFFAIRPYLMNTAPLGSTAAEEEILQLLDRVGISSKHVALLNCEGRSDCPPGQVVGLGPTKLMLFDSRLTSQTPKDQLHQVAAHEAKHFLLDNDFKPVIAVFLISIFIFLITQMITGAICRGSRHEDAPTPLVLTVFAVGLVAYLLAQPAVTTFQRNLELDADIFGLELNRNNKALVDIMWVDAKRNPILYRYTPVTKYFRATHPQIKDRIRVAETYHPWLIGEPLQYGEHFSE